MYTLSLYFPYCVQVSTRSLWFGRDVFGRRSLLWHLPQSAAGDDCLAISSVGHHDPTATPVSYSRSSTTSMHLWMGCISPLSLLGVVSSCFACRVFGWRFLQLVSFSWFARKTWTWNRVSMRNNIIRSVCISASKQWYFMYHLVSLLCYPWMQGGKIFIIGLCY